MVNGAGRCLYKFGHFFGKKCPGEFCMALSFLGFFGFLWGPALLSALYIPVFFACYADRAEHEEVDLASLLFAIVFTYMVIWLPYVCHIAAIHG